MVWLTHFPLLDVATRGAVGPGGGGGGGGGEGGVGEGGKCLM